MRAHILKSSPRFLVWLIGLVMSLGMTGPTCANTHDNEGLAAWARAHPDWQTDPRKLAHFASQCFTLFDVVGHFYATHPIHEEQRRSANIFLSNSDIYARIGYFLSLKQGITPEMAVQRHWSLKAQLNQSIELNLADQKNIMVPSFSADVELCLVHFKFAQVQAKQLEIEFANTQPSSTQPSSTQLSSPSDGPFDSATLEKIWAWIKSQTSAPVDANMPRLVVQPALPAAARMVFEFPSDEHPHHRMQINVSPRTLQAWSRSMVNWAVGHELVHYAMLMRENQWESKAVYKNEVKHHCNPEFMTLTAGIADLISDAQSPSRERLKMYSEVFRSCARDPDQ